jgi:predicted nucleic acid-binding protein
MVGIGNLFPFEVTGFRRKAAATTTSWEKRPKRGSLPTVTSLELPSKERSSVCRKAFYCMLIVPAPQHRPPHAFMTAPLAVLDTNVVLDWLLFGEPCGTAVGAAITAGRCRWIATEAMRDELLHVLARGVLDDWAPDLPALRDAWDRYCTVLPTPTVSGPAGHFRCTDPDDQKFIDLALASNASLLLSRDRAVLKLGRRLRASGVEVMTPATWAARQTAE